MNSHKFAAPGCGKSAQVYNGPSQFDISGQADWLYDVQSSANLSDWQTVDTVLATNNLIGFTNSNPVPAPQRFFRTGTLQ